MDSPNPAPPPPESFFRMNLAQTLTVGTVIMGMLWGVFGYGRDISDNTRKLTELSASVNKRMDKLEDYIARVDRDGTQYGKTSFISRNGESEATSKKVEKLEETVNKMVPEVTQISTNLEWISGWVKAQSQQPQDRKNSRHEP